MCLLVGDAYGIPTTALRFFNVYGPRQALCNPYTGVLAIFAGRMLNNAAPLVYEDGEQRRDFVHVTDVARAVRLCVETAKADGEVFNVGSGRAAHDPPSGRVAGGRARAAGPGPADDGQVPRRRHPALLRRHRLRPIAFSGTSRGRSGRTPWRSWPTGSPAETADDRVDAAAAELAERGLGRMNDHRNEATSDRRFARMVPPRRVRAGRARPGRDGRLGSAAPAYRH